MSATKTPQTFFRESTPLDPSLRSPLGESARLVLSILDEECLGHGIPRRDCPYEGSIPNFLRTPTVDWIMVDIGARLSPGMFYFTTQVFEELPGEIDTRELMEALLDSHRCIEPFVLGLPRGLLEQPARVIRSYMERHRTQLGNEAATAVFHKHGKNVIQQFGPVVSGQGHMLQMNSPGAVQESNGVHVNTASVDISKALQELGLSVADLVSLAAHVRKSPTDGSKDNGVVARTVGWVKRRVKQSGNKLSEEAITGVIRANWPAFQSWLADMWNQMS